MARIRTIKPEFTQNEDLSALPAETHLLAAGLLCYADDEGYFNANPGLVKAAIFPLRKIPEDSGGIPEMFSQLQKVGYLRFGGTPDGRRYGQVVNFAKHQVVSHLSRSKIKDLEIVWEDSGEIPEDSGSPPGTFHPEGKGKEQGKEQGSRREVKGKKASPTPLSRGDVSETLEFSEEALNARWWQFLDALKRQLGDAPMGHPNFSDVVNGQTDWGSCFEDLRLESAERTPGGLLLRTISPDPHVAQAGLLKYRKRIATLAKSAFGLLVEFQVTEPP